MSASFKEQPTIGCATDDLQMSFGVIDKAQERILVVDHEDHVRSILVRTLMAEGYDVTGTSSGSEALAKAADSTFGVLISEVRMRGMDGLETVRAIKARQPEIIAVMASGMADQGMAQAKAIAAGACAYFTKPYSLDGLLTTLEEVLFDGSLSPGQKSSLLVERKQRAFVRAF